MPTNKRITDLTDYTSVLPYDSEMFGVYQPMIGWKSKRIAKRLKQGILDKQNSLLQAYAKNFAGISQTDFIQCDATISLEAGTLQTVKLLKDNNSVLLQLLSELVLPIDKLPDEQGWKERINKDRVEEILNAGVADYYRNTYHDECVTIQSEANLNRQLGIEEEGTIRIRERNLESRIQNLLKQESAVAGAILAMADQNMFAHLEKIFYEKPATDLVLVNQQIAEMLNQDDPFATFDPKKDIKNVSLSPMGIVHLFRQYFFELDTFLGTPIGHVWLSPGCTVELIEVSTRRVYTEKIIEQSFETIQKKETSTTDKDEFSEAVKKDNKTDLKLGASLTVNQSWGTGNATATGSLNMDTTQSTARETTHKRMHEQSSKLSSEIRQNFKSTFKTITEITDTSSKRYLITNPTPDLINYELRRKMRQVGVQVQDIGTYLCWETFVDEPGRQLGLANLVNIAKPTDLVDVPDPTVIPPPVDKKVPFTGNVTWNAVKFNQVANSDHFLPLGTLPMPAAPEGYEPKFPGGLVDVFQLSGTGEGFGGVWTFIGRLKGITGIEVGPYIPPSGTSWDETINFVVGGEVWFKPTAATLKDIADANKKQVTAGTKATNENKRKTEEAFIKAAKERIELASNIKTRKYEDLREEERIIVYRELIGALMSDTFYGMLESDSNDAIRHTLSELLNSIFDIDKMLYFVAPEWWKPRQHSRLTLGSANSGSVFAGNLTSWSDLQVRPDNYFITEKSQYAKMGSSLGWLLQLDGDELRNAFLNAPWVKAVIPIRPGKELEASNWLQQMGIEGTSGLDNLYHGQEEELEKIRATLNIVDVTIADALKYLCAEVAAKHKKSLEVGRYPQDEINDDNRVSATPIDKVYEHGFYPLKGGFRAVTSEGYEVFDQWIEVLPTDQVVPVVVAYDPKTGRQI
jgi:hypothetical protein